MLEKNNIRYSDQAAKFNAKFLVKSGITALNYLAHFKSINKINSIGQNKCMHNVIVNKEQIYEWIKNQTIL